MHWHKINLKSEDMVLLSTASTNKICATCEYWAGIREIPKTKTSIRVDKKTKGNCFVKKLNIPKNTKATDRCSKWKKWSQI